MLIPHTEKKILSVHLSNLNLSVAFIIFFAIAVFGIIFSFKISERMADYDYYQQENVYYQKQIENIHQVIPSITKSQNTLFGKLDRVFSGLGVEGLTDSAPVVESRKPMDAISQLDNIDDKMENITQYIKNTKLLFSQIPSIFPLVTKSYWFSSPFGYRVHPITKQRHLHSGQDIATLPGTPIQATADGVVKTAGWSGPYGIAVYLIHGRGYATRYAHMMRTVVGSGATVKKGEIIGYVGSTGMSTGYHLHYEVLVNDDFLEPLNYMFLDRFGP